VRAWLLTVVSLSACGDNLVAVAPPLEHSDTLFLAAHFDDDIIFMQPALLNALREGATTTVYATTAGPNGTDRDLFEASKVAYGALVGSMEWECGLLALGDANVQHCRLRDRPVSLLDLGIPDGGIPGDRRDSLLHLFEGTVSELSLDNGGTVTATTVTDLFVRVFEATTPNTLETLELAGAHGRDHSSHMFVASIGLWAAARVSYAGAATWHRGYNVDVEMPNLGSDLLPARMMLGYWEACAYDCGPCGRPCDAVSVSHEIWLERQYASTRLRAASGSFALGDTCLGESLQLGDCASSAHVELDPTGAMRIREECLGSTAAGELVLDTCTGMPEQYWVLDSEGFVWNGRPPEIGVDMTYDHVRCLGDGRASTCGVNLQPRWQLFP
jgi:hypothetical protein